MNILFLTLGRVENIEEHSLYCDLLREFRDHGHNVYIVSPREKRSGLKTELLNSNNVYILRVKIGNITKCNIIEKGISTILIDLQFKQAISFYFSDIKFDLVMYSTPPITLVDVIDYIKKRDEAKTYLLLKDIFPQNAVDLGMLQKKGLKGLIYRFFRNKEKKLYAVSDWIGCMSQANVDYIVQHNPDVNPKIIEVCPNCVEVRDVRLSKSERDIMRSKYDIPLDKKVFVYGGNLGKPQGIQFLIECLKSQLENSVAFFLIVGDGTEYTKLESFFDESKPVNMKLMKRLSKEDYDRMVAACDVGMIFLDYRFTIPNFPSRLLAYMQAGLPVLACTDSNTDIGKVIVDNGFGWWCKSDEVLDFKKIVTSICANERSDMGDIAWNYLENNYSVTSSYNIIMNRFS